MNSSERRDSREKGYSLYCASCNAEFGLDTLQTCPNCGKLLTIKRDAVHNLIVRPDTVNPLARMWQFRELLPVSPEEEVVTLGEGSSPLVWGGDGTDDSPRVGLKLDYVNPTCSFKDRGASLLLTKARTAGAKSVTIDSSGNAAASVSAYAARAGLECNVFVPSYTSPDKVAQISSYGSVVSKIEGTREDVLKAARAFAEKSKSYYCGFQLNPFASEATKTVAFEIAQQMKWNVPDYVLLPMGTGSLLLGCSEGFGVLHEMKWITKVPRIIGVQAEGCSPIVRSFLTKSPIVPLDHPATIAEGLKIGNPYKGELVVEKIRESGGTAIEVSDQEIARASVHLARKHGVYAEPSGAVSTAGFAKLSHDGYFHRDQNVVCVVTGSGLKTGTPYR